MHIGEVGHDVTRCSPVQPPPSLSSVTRLVKQELQSLCLEPRAAVFVLASSAFHGLCFLMAQETLAAASQKTSQTFEFLLV